MENRFFNFLNGWNIYKLVMLCLGFLFYFLNIYALNNVIGTYGLDFLYYTSAVLNIIWPLIIYYIGQIIFRVFLVIGVKNRQRYGYTLQFIASIVGILYYLAFLVLSIIYLYGVFNLRMTIYQEYFSYMLILGVFMVIYYIFSTYINAYIIFKITREEIKMSFNENQGVFKSQDFEDFSDTDTYPEGEIGEEDTLAGEDYGMSDTGTLGEERIRDKFPPSMPKDQTIIMGKKKEALAWLIMLERGGLSKKLRLKEGSNLIGRSTRSDIVIDYEEVTQEHAKIIKEGKNYKLLDIGSLNGTFLNGKKVSAPRILKDGDEVRFANTKFIFKKI